MKKHIMSSLPVIAQIKVYFAGASLYISVINFLLIMATFKQLYRIEVSAFVVVPAGLAITIFIGFIDYKYIRRHENEHQNKMNDLKEQLDRIEAKL